MRWKSSIKHFRNRDFLYMWTPIEVGQGFDPTIVSPIRIFHKPQTQEYSIDTEIVLNGHGVYESLQMAKNIARGIITNGSWLNIQGKSCNMVITDEFCTEEVKK